MPFRDFISEDCICFDTTARSKTAVLLKVSQLLHQKHTGLDQDALFNAYWKRESLGSTTIGHGILIPHIRSMLINKISGCLIKLQNPVDFGAEDKQPVDLVVGLIAGAEQADEHLQILSKIIKQFNTASFRRTCRKASNQAELCQLFIQNSQYSSEPTEA
jgi:PTS system nitrogen regulatory IIA component